VSNTSNVRVEILSKLDNFVERLKRWWLSKSESYFRDLGQHAVHIELLFYQILMSSRRYSTWSSKQVGNYSFHYLAAQRWIEINRLLRGCKRKLTNYMAVTDCVQGKWFQARSRFFQHCPKASNAENTCTPCFGRKFVIKLDCLSVYRNIKHCCLLYFMKQQGSITGNVNRYYEF